MNLRIITSSPSLGFGGANKTMANLLDELYDRECETEWLCTGHNPTGDADWLGQRRFRIHSFPATPFFAIRRRQKLLLDHLRQRSPCIYIPNFDYDMACAIPALPSEIPAVFVVHSDEPVYYKFVCQYGQLFDAIVCVSRFIRDKLKAAHPQWADRIINIPFGVRCPEQVPARLKEPGSPLNVAYCGRISFYQKRIQDLAEIIRRCHTEKLPVRFHISGSGPDEQVFFESIAHAIADQSVRRLGFLTNEQLLDLYANADVLLMTSEFEGLPAVLLEAMAYGCIPVVSHTVSGMAEAVSPDENGFLIRIGDVNGFVHALSRLAADPALRHRLGAGAVERIHAGGFTLSRAAADYKELFKTLVNGPRRISPERNGSAILPAQYSVIERFKAWVRLRTRIQSFLGRLRSNHAG